MSVWGDRFCEEVISVVMSVWHGRMYQDSL